VNSNIVHNVLNWAIIALGAVTGALLASGCVETATGLDCAGSSINPAYTAWATAGLGTVKTVINVIRDGFTGLFKTQPPVE